MQTNITKWGNSQGIRIPKIMLELVNIADNDTVELTAENDTLIIKKAIVKKNVNIEDLFKDYKGKYEPISTDWGIPVGKEVW